MKRLIAEKLDIRNVSLAIIAIAFTVASCAYVSHLWKIEAAHLEEIKRKNEIRTQLDKYYKNSLEESYKLFICSLGTSDAVKSIALEEIQETVKHMLDDGYNYAEINKIYNEVRTLVKETLLKDKSLNLTAKNPSTIKDQ